MWFTAAPGFPWAVIVSGLVGVAGIVGTLLGGHLTNRAAEKRRLAEQQHEDRTRFHKERVEIYARFIGAFKAYRESMYPQRVSPLPVLIESRESNAPTPKAALAEVREALLLVAADDVANAANEVFTAAIGMENLPTADTGFDDAEKASLKALGEFRKAARAELLPNSNVETSTKKSETAPLQGGPD